MILKFYIEKLINSHEILTEEEYVKFCCSNAVLTKEEADKKKVALTPHEVCDMINYYEDKYGVGDLIQKAIDEGRFGDNPAKKATAKTMLNSAWGKHAQRLIMTEAVILNHTTQQNEVNTLFQNVADKVYSHQDSVILNDSEVLYRVKPKNAKVNLHNMYLPAAVFVTAYARLQLWRELNKLGDRVLYYDTDSIIYVRDPHGYNIPTGSMLGQWEIEKPCQLNDGLKTFVCYGPKTYAFTAWKQEYKIHTVVKAKGVSLKEAHSEIVNFQIMKQKVLDFLEFAETNNLARKDIARKATYASTIQVPQMQFRFSLDPEEGMTTVKSLKDLKINPKDFKGVFRNGFILPFGYISKEDMSKKVKAN